MTDRLPNIFPLSDPDLNLPPSKEEDTSQRTTLPIRVFSFRSNLDSREWKRSNLGSSVCEGWSGFLFSSILFPRLISQHRPEPSLDFLHRHSLPFRVACDLVFADRGDGEVARLAVEKPKGVKSALGSLIAPPQSFAPYGLFSSPMPPETMSLKASSGVICFYESMAQEISQRSCLTPFARPRQPVGSRREARGDRRRAPALDGRNPARRSHDGDQGNRAGLQPRRADHGAGVERRRRRHGGGGDLEKAPDVRGRRDKRFPAEVREAGVVFVRRSRSRSTRWSDPRTGPTAAAARASSFGPSTRAGERRGSAIGF
jgi:hypothetical protein